MESETTDLEPLRLVSSGTIGSGLTSVTYEFVHGA